MRTAKSLLLLGTILCLLAGVVGCFNPVRPQALFTASLAEQVVPFTVSFDGTLSYKPDGEIVSYLWTFGDGGAETGPLADHMYIQDGVYDVRLTVIDDQGFSTSATMTVRALNPPPTAGFSYGPRSNLEGGFIVGASEPITFDGTQSDDDGQVVSYGWYFGDGETAEGAIVEHRYLYPGTYNVVLTVTDDDGGVATYVEQVMVLGGPPCNADLPSEDFGNNGGT